MDNNYDVTTILILGGDGVNKSIFINAFANYLMYPKFEQVQSEKIIALALSEYTAQDITGRNRTIKIGSNFSTTQQQINSYTFPFHLLCTNIKIIAASIPLTEKQEQFNSKNMFSHVQNLNAVFFLLKNLDPNNKAFLDFCVQHIFCHFEEDSLAKNVIFIIDSDNPQDMCTGSLKDFFEGIREMNLFINAEVNKYCINSKTFKKIAAYQYANNIKCYGADFKEEWEKCIEQSWR